MGLSVFIITLNEADKIRKCIESIKEIADEIIIMDGGSTDGTVEIAKEYGAKIFVHPFDTFPQQKKRALEKCSHEWVLSLDADEVVSSELAREIKQSLSADVDGFFINRITWYKNTPLVNISRGEYILRLARKQKVVIEGRYVHEKMVVNGKVAKLTGSINHFSFNGAEDLFNKILKYAKFKAKEKIERGERGSLITGFFSGIANFFKFFILKVGFMDGTPGFLFSLSTFIYPILVQAFIKEWKQ